MLLSQTLKLMQIVMLNVIPQVQKTEFILFLQSLQHLLITHLRSCIYCLLLSPAQ